MKTKIIAIAIAFIGFINNESINAQTPVDFNRPDCNGNNQHLFADLSAGKAVIIELFMLSCASCVTAGDALEAMKADLLAKYPGKIKSYAIGYTNSYTCSSIVNWVNTNGYSAIPMDSGSYQTAWYGGMGMPTIVILGGGSTPVILGAGTAYVGFVNSDTVTMSNDIENYLNATGVAELSTITDFTMYPNPSQDALNLNFQLLSESKLMIDIVDISGKQVKNLINESVGSGAYNKTFDTSSLSNGSYLIRVNTNNTVTNYKLNIIR